MASPSLAFILSLLEQANPLPLFLLALYNQVKSEGDKSIGAVGNSRMSKLAADVGVVCVHRPRCNLEVTGRLCTDLLQAMVQGSIREEKVGEWGTLQAGASCW